MRPLDIVLVQEFVEREIGGFHQSRLNVFNRLNLRDIVKRKNPYLVRAKNITLASQLVTHWLTAYLSSSEEELFGQFMEKLAIFIASQTCDVIANPLQGVDLLFKNGETVHIVQIKSGPNWGNSDQQRRLRQNFAEAKAIVEQVSPLVQCTLGICYGKKRPTTNGSYQTLTGSSFWKFISGNERLYIDIVEPIGYHAREHNAQYQLQYDQHINILTAQVLNEFCVNGEIHWESLLKLSSDNSQ